MAAPGTRAPHEDDEEDWSESESSSSSDSDLSDLEAKDMEALRRYFLKVRSCCAKQKQAPRAFVQAEFRGGEDEVKDEAREKRRKERRERHREKEARQRQMIEDDDEGWIHTGERVSATVFLAWEYVLLQERPRLFDKDTKITFELVMQKFGEICMQRGKKTRERYTMVDRYSAFTSSSITRNHFNSLVELMDVTNNAGMGPAVQLKILLAIVHGTFEINLRISDCMKYESWTT